MGWYRTPGLIDRLRMSSEVIHAIMEAPDKGIPEEVRAVRSASLWFHTW